MRITRFVALILFIVIATVTVLPTYGQSSPPASVFDAALRPEFRQDIQAHPDAPRYTMDITLSLTADVATLQGDLQVKYTNRTSESLETVVFRLYPNLPSFGGDLQVQTITIVDQTVLPEFDSTRSVMAVPLPTELAPEQSVILELQFESIIQAGDAPLYDQYSYINGTLAVPNFFPLLSVYEPGSGWWQVTDHPQGDAVFSETAFFDVTLTAPAELVVITSGSLIASQNNDDNTRTHRFVGALIRDFALMAYNRYMTLSDSQSGIAIDVHYLPGGEDGAVAVMEYTKNSLRVFSETFGAYPYAELDVVETYTTAGGIEYPGLIVVQDDAWNAVSTYLEYVTAHEVAHQWWYSLVGNDQTRYPWLDESLTQYSTALYYGQVRGPEAQAAVLDDYQSGWERFVANNPDLPVGLPAAEYTGSEYFRIVYQKGPLFFATLADTYGEPALLAALSAYFDANRYQIATPTILQDILETELQDDLDAVFTEWIGLAQQPTS
ncbi:MAG: M1 family metallopeptidase [Chloroflexi bacterium]|nr:M1 family metallopeptidase [Chloroflexota bacterium]